LRLSSPPTRTHTVNPDPTKFSFHISKALNDDGLGTASSVLVGIEGCMNSGSRIISMSLGGGPSSDMVAPVDGRRQRDERQKASR
jgi:subtilisin family serine protease